jgi:hypothetical protein
MRCGSSPRAAKRALPESGGGTSCARAHASSVRGPDRMATSCAYDIAPRPPRRNGCCHRQGGPYWTPRCAPCGVAGPLLHHLRVAVPADDLAVPKGIWAAILDSRPVVRLPATRAGETPSVLPRDTLAAWSFMPVRDALAFAIRPLPATVAGGADPSLLHNVVRESSTGHEGQCRSMTRKVDGNRYCGQQMLVAVLHVPLMSGEQTAPVVPH